MNDIKLDVTLDELSIINCALDDYYGSMVKYYRTSEYYEVKEIKSLKDRVNALGFKEQEKVEKNKAKQPKPDW
tara:strand:- start:27 stop:245 length:219 start_codon:yes stop_codon:yes gene_type:complete